MDYFFLNEFLVVLLIQHCTSQDLSTSNQSSSMVSLQDGQAFPHEPEVPPADVMPVMAPPSMKEVHQIMQEESEKVEGHRAEEVLKELLEKVVVAAMGQVEGGGEAKGDEAALQEAVTEDALGAENGEADTKAEVLEQAVEEKEVEGEDTGTKGGDTAVGGEQVFAEGGAFKDVAEEGKGVVKGKWVTAAGSMEETTAGVETGDRNGVEIINYHTEVSQEETVAAIQGTGGDLTTQEAVVEDSNEQVVLSKEKGAAETKTHETEETPDVVKVALGEEQDSVETFEPSLVVAGVEQVGDIGGKEGALVEDTQVDEMKGEVILLPSDTYDTETTHNVVGELVEEEEEMNRLNNAEGPEVKNKQGHVMMEGGVAGEEEVEDTVVAETTGGERDGDSEKLVNEKADQRAGEEAHIALQTSHGTETEDQEVPVTSDPVSEDGAEAFLEQSPENQAPTLSPSLGEVETGENILGDNTPNHVNEIITPTDDLLPHDPAVAQPTLDNFLKDVQLPQSVRDETREPIELVEDPEGTTETTKLGLEAWKIGAISAAVLVVVETVVIIFYILKCRKKNSIPALQRACEEGCVEPEEATGGDCSDDTLPADNGDTEQKATLDSPNVASTLTHNKEQHATALSDFPSTSTEKMANTGPGPDSSQDLRTSML